MVRFAFICPFSNDGNEGGLLVAFSWLCRIIRSKIEVGLANDLMRSFASVSPLPCASVEARKDLWGVDC